MRHSQHLLFVGCLLALVGWHAADADLIAYYSMEETGSPLVDQTGGQTAPAVDGGHLYSVQGPLGFGNAVELNANGSWQLSVADSAELRNLANDMTVASWVYLDSTTFAGKSGVNAAVQRIMGDDVDWDGDGWSWGVNNTPGIESGVIRFTKNGIVDADDTSGAVVPTDVWAHLAVTVSSTAGIQFYLNGVDTGTPNGNTANIIPSPGNNGLDDPWAVGRSYGNAQEQWFGGRLDEVRVYDNVLTPFEINQLVNPGVGVFNLEIDRDAGVMQLRNDSTTARVISGIDMTSAAGSFDPSGWLSITDNYDADDGGEVDPVNNWTKFSDNVGNLAEGTLGTTTIGAGQVIEYGAAWFQSPFEDVRISLLLEDGTLFSPLVNFVGNDDLSFQIADLNFDGIISELDWPIYRDGYREDLTGLSTAQAYRRGDLNSDGVNDVVDFALFKTTFDAANGAGAFDDMIAGIPEPTSVLTLLVGALLVGARLRKSISRKCVLNVTAVAMLGAALMLPVAVQAQVPTLVSNWTLDTNGNDSVGDNDGTSTNVTFNQPGANGNTGSAALFDGSTSTIDVPFSPALNPASFTVTLWANASSTAGFQSPITSRDDVNLGESTHGYIIYNNSGGNWDFWTGDGDPGWATLTVDPVVIGAWTHVAISFDAESNRKSIYLNGNLAASVTNQGYSPNGTVESENLHIGSGADDGGEFFFDGLIDDVGVYNGVLTQAEIQNVRDKGVSAFAPLRLGLQVNTTTGLTTLRNDSGVTIDFDQYEVLSPGDSLDPISWNSLQDQDYDDSGPPNGTGDGWEELGTPRVDFVGEAFLQGSSPLIDGTTIGLGRLYDTSVGMQDLEFSYRLASGAVETGVVDYITGPSGDFDGNGVYECADVDALVGEIVAGTNNAMFDLTGDGAVNINDLDAWRAEAGAGINAPPLTASGNPVQEGDANLDGVVDVSDFNNWNGNKFTNTPAWCNGDFNADGVIDVSDFNLWNGNKFQSADGYAAVPEPCGLLLLCGGAVLLWGRKLRRFATAVCCLLLVTSIAAAGVSNDRVYKFGEGEGENGVAGAIIGSGVTIPGAGDALDDLGPSGAFIDLEQSGNPTYVDVNGGAKARPGTSPGDLGAQFDGTSTVLQTPFPLNRPDELDALVGGGYPLNYDGIIARGAQMWVYPDQTGLNAGVFQSIVFDSIISGGPAITGDGKWTQINSQHADGSDGVAPIIATVDVPGGDQWYHVMHHNYHVSGDNFDIVMYVNGIAVSANNDTIDGQITLGSRVGVLSVGAAEIAGDGVDPAFGNFFGGVVDNLEMYVYGDNSSLGGMDYGAFDLFADNAWIANEIATMVPGGVLVGGDVNKDGAVNGNGLGPIESDDVSAFVAGWKVEKRFVGAHNTLTAGDWETWDNGDMNHDGITDLLDWHILRSNHPTPGSLDLAQLLNGVPEPSMLTMLLCAALSLLPIRKCRHH